MFVSNKSLHVENLYSLNILKLQNTFLYQEIDSLLSFVKCQSMACEKTNISISAFTEKMMFSHLHLKKLIVVITSVKFLPQISKSASSQITNLSVYITFYCLRLVSHSWFWKILLERMGNMGCIVTIIHKTKDGEMGSKMKIVICKKLWLI